MSWNALAAQDVHPADAAAQMGCDVGTAVRRLEEARAQSSTQNTEDAVALLLHSGIGKPSISKRRWTDVALGIAGNKGEN